MYRILANIKETQLKLGTPNTMPSKSGQEPTQQLEEAAQTARLEDTAYDPAARPIWERIVEIGAQVPESEWAQVPSDLSRNLKHYLHGGPKDDK